MLTGPERFRGRRCWAPLHPDGVS